MRDLIEALVILLKYGDAKYPTICEHDQLIIADIDPNKVSQSDKDQLADLGFDVVGEHDLYFRSTRFGSA